MADKRLDLVRRKILQERDAFKRDLHTRRRGGLAQKIVLRPFDRAVDVRENASFAVRPFEFRQPHDGFAPLR